MQKVLLLLITLLSVSINAQEVSLGADDNPALSDGEADFLNDYFSSNSNGFDFKGKKVLILGGPGGSHLIGKKIYFNNIATWQKNHGGMIATGIYPLTEEEKVKSGGYDAILTCWVKVPVTPAKKKRIIRKISKRKWKVPGV